MENKSITEHQTNNIQYHSDDELAEYCIDIQNKRKSKTTTILKDDVGSYVA